MKYKRILFLSFILIFAFQVVLFAYPYDADIQEIEYETVNNESVEIENIPISTDWLSYFLEIDENILNEKLKTSIFVSATLNNNSNNLYVILKQNDILEYYKITNVSAYLLSYIQLQHIPYKVMNFNDTYISPIQEASTELKMAHLTIYVFGALFLAFMVLAIIGNFQKKETVSASMGAINVLKVSSDIPQVKFDDVEGIAELKADIMRVVDCLKHPEKYQNMGARVPKGVILYGPPGTGKTLLAKAVAGEAGVPFLAAVGSDFVEKYVGVGAQRVRDLYKKARSCAPCIVFIDEVDAVAGQRGRDDNSEADQTINALLAELDGFKGTENIITICATNRLDMLDSAFKRAGRFDLKLAVGLPDKAGRYSILSIYAKNKKLDSSVNLDNLADRTVGFSGAELESLLNEAALVAVGKDKKSIDNEDIDDAFFKLVMQGNKKKREKITEINKVIAWHEAGHTLATKLLTDDGVSSVTIIGSSSGAGGVTFRNPKEDNILHSKSYLESLIQIMYAGRAAEELYFGDKDKVTTGASQDIKQASTIIKEYLSINGMGKLGMLDLSQFRNDYEDIIEEASEMSQSLYNSVFELLNNNYCLLQELANTLLEKETLDEVEIDSIIQKYIKK